MNARHRADGRVPILYIAPWVDIGGTDTGTIDWFRWIDRSRFAPSLITTQPSANRRLNDVVPYADEVWSLPDLMPGKGFPEFILDFIENRGVQLVHIMNSRLGFDMIPDLKCLSPSPAIVVQLHVEEPDASGYVQYVATRYGNLVDGFSLTSRHLTKAVQHYDVPSAKCHLIYTGVDGTDTFVPDRSRERLRVPQGVCHILYCGRLCDQKDPMLMVRIARRLRERGRDFRIHVVGDGPLEDKVRGAVSAARLTEQIVFHGAQRDTVPWFGRCDLMLMTSVFEGIPYVMYEAMAMAVPTVAPAIPGNVELLGDIGVLVTPRDDVEAYADAVERLMDDPQLALDLGRRARQRVLDGFSLEKMGREHGELYNALLSGRRTVTNHESAFPEQLFLRTRQLRDQPLVSVVIPCYEHGSYLQECIDSVMAQTYSNIEVVVVDDASRDAMTRGVLDNLSTRSGIKVIRLTRNLGPSSARQRGVDEASGRYVLPVDADNHLTTDAVESLVRQLQESNEQVGFVYPNQTFFGMRNDTTMAPSYNADLLLDANYCDTSSLIDVDVFAAGVRYGRGLRWVHEDWDFALSLAERGVRGAPARGRFLTVRKSGFTRSDLVTRAGRSEATLRSRHPALYDHRAAVKSRWSPALSIIAADPIENLDEARRRLRLGLRAQTCIDAEIIVRDDAWWSPTQGPHLRHVAAAHDESPGAAVASGLGMARGKYVMVIRGNVDEFFLDCAAIEKVLRLFVDGAERDRPIGFLGLANATHAFAPIASDRAKAETAVAVAWPANMVGDHKVVISSSDPLPSICAALTQATRLPISWRQLPLRWTHRAVEGGSTNRSQDVIARLAGGWPVTLSESERHEQHARLSRSPILLDGQTGTDRRIDSVEGWHPALTRVLYRHVDPLEMSYMVTFDHTPPAHHVLDYALGCVNTSQHKGAPELVVGADSSYRIVRDDEARRAGDGLLGYVESVPFPLLDSLFVARHRLTGRQVLVSGEDDPILGDVDLITHLGFVEPHPLRPRSGRQGTREGAASRELSRLSPLTGQSARYRMARRVASRLVKYPAVYSVARRAYRLTTRQHPGEPRS